MSIEEIIIQYLKTALDVSVSGEVPTDAPAEFVTVEKTGSSEENLIVTSTLAIQSWSGSRAAAAALNETVKAAMRSAATLNAVCWCHCQGDYNYTDTTTKHHRYQAVFEVVHYL